MKKLSTEDKKLLKELNAELKILQKKLVEANKLEGNDAYIDVKVQENRASFRKIKKEGAEDKATGEFFIKINITAKQSNIFVPLSIASGKKTAGFMYHIEGTGAGSIVTAEVKVRGEKISQVTVGTLLFAKIPAGQTASFSIRTTIRGGFGKTYHIAIVRLNYKLRLTDARYQQYLKEIQSKKVKFS